MKHKAINGWTKDKIIDHVKANFKGKAVIADPCYVSGLKDTCVYLTEDGKKCAVGMFIPEGHEGQSETGTADDLLELYPELTSKMPLNTDGLLDFQNEHDTMDNDLGVNYQLELLVRWIERNIA